MRSLGGIRRKKTTGAVWAFLLVASWSGGCGSSHRQADGGAADGEGSVATGCEPSSSETRLTLGCGSEMRTCGGERMWGPWVQTQPDQAEPECRQGEARFAGREGCEENAVRYFRCGSACTWETVATECGGGCDGTRRVSPLLEEEICVPGGAVEIGCEYLEAESGSLSCDPRHTVYLTPYYIDRFPVVVGRYQECVAAGACTPLRPYPTGAGLLDDVVGGYPGAQIRTATHEQAGAFCEWDGAELVTGAQWERAAIGINTDVVFFPWERPEPDGEPPYCSRLGPCACTVHCLTEGGFPGEDITTLTLSLSSINVGAMWRYPEWTSDVISPYPTDGVVVTNPRYPQVGPPFPPLPYESRGQDVRYPPSFYSGGIAVRDGHRDPSYYYDRSSFRCSRPAVGSRTGDRP